MIIANWKMYGSRELLHAYIQNLSGEEELIVCPPYPLLAECAQHFRTGSQNCHTQAEGPFTGEVSPQLLHDIGCRYTLLGHSERRQHFDETDALIAEKAEVAFNYELIPIVCIGSHESDWKREKERLYEQIRLLPEEIWLAYEPVWSIGTDKVPQPEHVKRVVDWLKEETGTQVVFYGGSVNPLTAPALLKTCDGFLVGRASLDVKAVRTLLDLVKKPTVAPKIRRRTNP